MTRRLFDPHRSGQVSGRVGQSRKLRLEPLEERCLLSIDLVSISLPSLTGSLGSGIPSISGDGRYVAFESMACNLVPGDTNGTKDVFVMDRATGATILAGATNFESDTFRYSAAENSISSDGRYVVFRSDASDVVPGDTNGVSDVFVKDLVGGSTTRASSDSAGNQGNGDCRSPSISGDGRYVAFDSSATNLVSGVEGNYSHVYVKDLVAGTIVLVDADGSGNPGNSLAYSGDLSADGRYVCFESESSNLVPDDTNDRPEVFVKDLVSGTVTVVAALLPRESGSPALSANGRYVAFHSEASDLIPEDTGNVDVFVMDLWRGITTRVSTDSAGAPANGNSAASSISSDGRYVAFQSDASNLVADDTNDCLDIFVKDIQSGVTKRVSKDPAGSEGNAASQWPRISGDGRFVTFETAATNFASPDTNHSGDVFIADVLTGQLSLVSARMPATRVSSGNRDSLSATISADGRYVAFESLATDLAPVDANVIVSHVYVSDVLAGTTIACNPQSQIWASKPSISGDGRYVAFLGSHDAVCVNDTWTGSVVRSDPPPIHTGTLSTGPEVHTVSLSSDGRYVACAANYQYSRLALIEWATVCVTDLQTGAQSLPLDFSSAHNVCTYISGDGRFLASETGQVFVSDREGETTVRVSSDALGNAANGKCDSPSCSSDGRYVAYASLADNLVADDTNARADIFVADMLSGTTVRASTDSLGGQANAASSTPRMSGDGRYVTFASAADNLVPGDTNGRSDIFVKDLGTGAIVRVSLGTNGEQANQDSMSPALSADGRYIVFHSSATNLHPLDVSSTLDVFRVWNPFFPPEVALTAATIAENRPVGTPIGLLATGGSGNGPFAYSLTVGEGDADNSLFEIVGNELRTHAVFDFEDRSSYRIRVHSGDGIGQTCETAFTIRVTDVYDCTTPGLFDSTNSVFYLRNSNSAGYADAVCTGIAAGEDWIELAGDWDGDGADSLGFFDPAASQWRLFNDNADSEADSSFGYGDPRRTSGHGRRNWVPVVGDWDGDGRDTVGVFDPVHCLWYLRNTLSSGYADCTFAYGDPARTVGHLDHNWKPIVGDWDADGCDTVGLFDPQHCLWYLRDSLSTGFADRVLAFGDPMQAAGRGASNWVPIVGNWDGKQSDTIGFFDPAASVFMLRNSLTTGIADLTFGYGSPGANWRPVCGCWDSLIPGPSPTTPAESPDATAVDQLDLAELAEQELNAW